MKDSTVLILWAISSRNASEDAFTTFIEFFNRLLKFLYLKTASKAGDIDQSRLIHPDIEESMAVLEILQFMNQSPIG